MRRYFRRPAHPTESRDRSFLFRAGPRSGTDLLPASGVALSPKARNRPEPGPNGGARPEVPEPDPSSICKQKSRDNAERKVSSKKRRTRERHRRTVSSASNKYPPQKILPSRSQSALPKKPANRGYFQVLSSAEE